MVQDNLKNSYPPGSNDDSSSLLFPQQKINTVKEILHQLTKTFSQLKIFSSDHPNIKKFTDLLYSKLHLFLVKHWKLQLGVEEFSFTFEEKPVFTETQINKSLPFLFYKDGIRMLFFYQGLKKEELIDFLEIIKKNSSLPAEESDVVISLWEKDLANIRYYAPYEFLETKIGEEREILTYQVDKKNLIEEK